MKQNGYDLALCACGKKTIPAREKMLLIEDEQGRTISYYPGLAWNGSGAYRPRGCQGIQEEEDRLPSETCIGNKSFRSTTPLFGDFDLAKKILSMKNILGDICGKRCRSIQTNPAFLKRYFEEDKASLHSDLLYLIAATDGDEDTFGHSQLVARYTLLLTEALGIDDRKFSADIEMGALLHDIGKIGIPESILRKAGPLTERENEIIREHPLLGYEMVQEFLSLRRASRVILFHHERYDGRGYPYGLKGEEIPLEARIFSIADTLGAITSDRPYRKGRSLRVAFDEIERFRGTQFDPRIVDIFLSVPQEKWQHAKFDTEISFPLYSFH